MGRDSLDWQDSSRDNKRDRPHSPRDSRSRSRSPGSRRKVSDPETVHARIFVGNVQPAISNKALKEYFTRWGNVIHVFTNRQGAFGFVEFQTENEAQTVIAAGHKPIINGIQVVIKPAKVMTSDQKSAPPPAPGFGTGISVNRDNFDFGGLSSYMNAAPSLPEVSTHKSHGYFDDFGKPDYHKYFSEDLRKESLYDYPSEKDLGKGSYPEMASTLGSMRGYSPIKDSKKSGLHGYSPEKDSRKSSLPGYPSEKDSRKSYSGSFSGYSMIEDSEGKEQKASEIERHSLRGMADEYCNFRSNKMPEEVTKTSKNNYGYSEGNNFGPPVPPVGNFGPNFPGSNNSASPFSLDPNRPTEVEIVVPDRNQRTYAEAIEYQLKEMGLIADLLFPPPDIPLNKVLADLKSRSCLFVVHVVQENEQFSSASLYMLADSYQEHLNMPLEDFYQLIKHEYGIYLEKQKILQMSKPKTKSEIVPPEIHYLLTNVLEQSRPLTVEEYEKLLVYLKVQQNVARDEMMPPDTLKPHLNDFNRGPPHVDSFGAPIPHQLSNPSFPPPGFPGFAPPGFPGHI